MQDSENSLNAKFIKCLFNVHDKDNDISKIKRFAIITFAVKSKIGANLVYCELQSRLRVTQDVFSAEILGELLEKDFSMSDDFAELAVEILGKCI